MSTLLFWFRTDLRLHDQRALHAALQQAPARLLPVFVHPPADEWTPWGFARVGPHRRVWLDAALRDLARRLDGLGCPLLQCTGRPADLLPRLARSVGASGVVCEALAAPQELDEVAALRAGGLPVHPVWQGTLLDPERLPFPVARLPGVFTAFRQAVERAGLQPDAPLPPPGPLPPWPDRAQEWMHTQALECAQEGVQEGTDALAPAAASGSASPHSSFPYARAAFDGGEAAALAHVERYLARGLPHSYKETRNALRGIDFSSKCSPWLATGALSPRHFLAALRRFEAEVGASEGSYWLWFELLWRDYFRLLHLQHGRRLYRARGLAEHPGGGHDAAAFAAWCAGQTGEPLVDAGMRELAATGYLSNRMRQIVASYLIHDLGGDWRAGAAWFEAQLIDFDVYSNQGNWLYIAGRGTDPRGGRRFNPVKQAAEHDADGEYRRLWGTLP